jgi:Prealbumin-like fold domain
MQLQKLLTIPAIAIMATTSCSAQTDPTPASDSGTGIEGVIAMGPIHGGPVRPGIPTSKPLANTQFVVKNKTSEVASFTTDDQGKFRVALAPGHYTVFMKNKKGAIGHYGPFEVDVVAGKMTTVNWECDTGMR